MTQRRIDGKHWLSREGSTRSSYANRIPTILSPISAKFCVILRSQKKCFGCLLGASETTMILSVGLELNFRHIATFFSTNGMVFRHLTSVPITVSEFVYFRIRKILD